MNITPNQIKSINRVLENNIHRFVRDAVREASTRHQPRFVEVGIAIAALEDIDRLQPLDFKKPESTWVLTFKNGNQWTMGSDVAKQVRSVLLNSRY